MKPQTAVTKQGINQDVRGAYNEGDTIITGNFNLLQDPTHQAEERVWRTYSWNM